MKQLPVLATAVACLGSFFIGYDSGVMTGVLAIPETEERFGLDRPLVRGLVVSSLYMGALVSSFIASIPMDLYGRRYSIIIGSVLFSIGVLLQAASFHVEQIIVGRIIAGIAVGIMHASIPIYIAEIAEKRRRGALATLIELVLVLGVMSSFLVSLGAYHLDGNVGFRLAFALPLLCVPPLIWGMYRLPESPRWLLAQGRTEDALDSLSRFRNLPKDDVQLQKEYEDLRSSIEQEAKCSAVSYSDLFAPGARKSFFIAATLLSVGELSGLGAIFNFIPDVLRMANIQDPDEQLLIGAGRSGAALLSTIICTCLVDRVGRRPLFITGALIMAISMTSLSVFISNQDSSHFNRETMSYGSITAIYLFTMGYNISWNSIAFIYAAEILPQRIRAKALSISIGLYWSVRTIVVQLAPFLFQAISWGVFVIFACVCIISAAGIYHLLPETKGIQLEDMEEILKNWNLRTGYIHNPHYVRVKALSA
jgi:sugar porter (SP) family MFS transporter